MKKEKEGEEASSEKTSKKVCSTKNRIRGEESSPSNGCWGRFVSPSSRQAVENRGETPAHQIKKGTLTPARLRIGSPRVSPGAFTKKCGRSDGEDKGRGLP